MSSFRSIVLHQLIIKYKVGNHAATNSFLKTLQPQVHIKAARLSGAVTSVSAATSIRICK